MAEEETKVKEGKRAKKCRQPKPVSLRLRCGLYAVRHVVQPLRREKTELSASSVDGENKSKNEYDLHQECNFTQSKLTCRKINEISATDLLKASFFLKPTWCPELLQMINARTSKSGRIYGPGVLLGNWFEDVCLEEESLKDFLYKRENGELLIQKSRRLKDTLYKKEQLSISKDGYIHFGDTVLFLNLDVVRLPEEKALIMGGNLSLAVNPDISTLYTGNNLSAPCDLSAIEHVKPVGRNAFRILSLEGEAMGEPVRFGQNFGLGATGGFQDKMLFLTSDHKSFQNMAKKSSLQAVFMTDELSYLCAWQMTFVDPQLRMEYEGLPIPANTKVVIVHSHTNQALAVPRTFWIRTYFGKECEMNCHTYLDSHKAEESKNHWIIVTGNPSDDSTTMFDRPKPPSEETRAQNREEL